MKHLKKLTLRLLRLKVQAAKYAKPRQGKIVLNEVAMKPRQSPITVLPPVLDEMAALVVKSMQLDNLDVGESGIDQLHG